MAPDHKRYIPNSIKNYVQPKRFYQELAEEGLLEEFLKYHLKELYSKDQEFKDEMIEILFRHSPEAVHEVEVFYLEKMCESLGYFLEYTKQWMIQKP
jgi:hypothetical protein